MDTGDRLLTPGEVAALFRVDPKTVTRWAAAGRIGSIRTPGGHRRFRESEVRALLEGEGLTKSFDALVFGYYEDGKLIRFLGEETGDDEEVLMKIMKRLLSGG